MEDEGGRGGLHQPLEFSYALAITSTEHDGQQIVLWRTSPSVPDAVLHEVVPVRVEGKAGELHHELVHEAAPELNVAMVEDELHKVVAAYVVARRVHA